MDRFHHKEKRNSITGRASPVKGSPKNSPKMAPVKPAKLEIGMESPPLVSFGAPAHSSGALSSGQLLLTILDPEVKFNELELQLLQKFSTKKPVSKDCADCTINKVNVLKTWNFFTEATTFKEGMHSLPFSYLLPGELPASTVTSVGNIEYILSARGLTSLSDTITYERPLNLQRALTPGSDRSSVRIFPPTNLSATVTLAPVIHPIGEFPVLVRLTGVVDPSPEKVIGGVHQWRIRKMNWKIEEHTKIISAACPKHAHKIGGEGKGVLHQDTRSIGGEELKKCWKSDFDEPGGVIELEFSAAIKANRHPVCDVESATGVTVTHNLVLEMVVGEEYGLKMQPRSIQPTGAARVLRMQFSLIVTERSGMGISWDEEQPPMYEDVPGSPPTYPSMTDYEGEPLPYEELDSNAR